MGSIEFKNAHQIRHQCTLVCIDGSYVVYKALFSTVKKWIAESPYSDCIENVDVANDDFEKVDLTLYPDFIDMLNGRLIDFFKKIGNMVLEFNDVNCAETYGDMLFVLDPEYGAESRSWRYGIYPEYKGQRKSDRDKKPYHVNKIFAKAIELIRDGGKMERRFGFRVVSANNAEADDIIATIFMDEENASMHKFLVASDHDYLQLDHVIQMNLDGQQVAIEQPYPEEFTMTPEMYLLAKIITGDASDNITQVFNRVGYKTAAKKYVMNPEFLNESLENDPIAMEKFNRNTRLIDFSHIPKRIRAAARKAVALG